MPETPENPDLKPANQNPWYLLMTVCGEQEGEAIDHTLHARNRRIWNGWAAEALSADEKKNLIAEGWVRATDLAALTAEERTQINERFAEAGLSTDAIPPPRNRIHLSQTRFDPELCAIEFVFPVTTMFTDARFSRQVWFIGARFLQSARFDEARFLGHVWFIGARFSGVVSFTGARFSGFAQFGAARFGGPFGLENCRFNNWTSFYLTRFEKEPLRLYGATLHENTDLIDAKWPLVPGERPIAKQNRDAYSRLKLLMADQHKFRDEHFFLRKELECSEVVEGFPKNIPSRLYGLFSDYGASIARPLAGLSLSTVLGAFVFAGAGPSWSAWPALALSASNQIAFFGFNRTLIGADELVALPWWAKLVSAGQTVFAALLLFLLLLALRNRFRIR